jgi:septal ring-binding cell division protein DamX
VGTPPPPSAPPLLLIDPQRFRLDQTGGMAMAAEPAAPTPAPEPEPEPVTERASAPPPPVPVPADPPVLAIGQPTGGTEGNPEFSALTPGQYTVQLAAASMPDGFGALLQRLGAPGPSWQLRLNRGGQTLWVLVLGVFPDAASARAAVPAGASGAFPKPVVQLQQELATPL